MDHHVKEIGKRLTQPQCDHKLLWEERENERWARDGDAGTFSCPLVPHDLLKFI